MQQLRFGLGEGLLAGGQLGFGAHDFNGGQGSDLDLLLVVAVKSLVQGHGLLLDLHVLVEADQVPVGPDDRGDCGHDLLLEGQVADPQIVLGDADVAIVDRNPEALQEMLGEVQAQGAGHGRVEIAAAGVGPQSTVGITEADVGPRKKPLLNAELVRIVSNDQCAGAGAEGVALGGGAVGPVPLKEQSRVQVGNRAASRGNDGAAGAACGAGDQRRAAARTGCAAGGLGQGAGGGLLHRGGHPSQQAARLGAHQAGVGLERAVALQGDIQVVLERQGNGVLEGEIDLAGPQQRFEAVGVGQINWRGLLPLEVMGQAGEPMVIVGLLGRRGLRAGRARDQKKHTQNG